MIHSSKSTNLYLRLLAVQQNVTCRIDWLKFQTYLIHTRLDRLLFSGSEALQKWKNFENRTTFRYAYLLSKFYYIAPLMNYSQYSLEGYKILVSGLGKNLKRILRSMYICLTEKWKKKFWGHPRGVRQPPKNRGFGHY